MKKFLLLAVAALSVGTVMAQSTSKKVAQKSKNQVQQTVKVERLTSIVSPAKKALDMSKKQAMMLQSKKIELNASNLKYSAANASFKASAARRAGTVQPEYTGSGSVTGNGATPWKMLTGANQAGDTLFIADVIPNPYPSSFNYVVVDYTLNGDKLTIKPQKVFASSSWVGYIFGGTSDDGSIEMTLGEDGSLTVPDGETIYYGAFADAFDPTFETYFGYIEYVSKITYTLPGQIVAPTVEYNPEGMYLHTNVSSSFYGYSSADFANVSPYAPYTMVNGTTSVADAWAWSLYNDDSTKVVKETTKDFVVNVEPGYYIPAELIGYNQELASNPFIIGLAQGNKTVAYIKSGFTEDEYAFSDGSYGLQTLANTDNSLSYYSSFATPDKNTNRSISQLVLYQGKPSTPLYFEGINMAVSRFTINKPEEFNLKCKIQRITMEANGWPTLGEVIAEADLTADNIVVGYEDDNYNMTHLQWRDFYVMDENGMSTSLPYLFVDEEFAIVIDGWDNGTFTCEHTWGEGTNNESAAYSTFYFKTGDEIKDENMYRLGYRTKQLIGFSGVIGGYLYTEDATDMTIAAEGGEAKIHVKPMFCSVDDETQAVKTRLFLDENIEDNEIPEWLEVSYTEPVQTGADEDGNPDYDLAYDLTFKAAALPEGVSGRQANLVFMQEGAQLKVTVTQGEATGIATAKAEVKAGKAQMFNLAGQRVNNGYKGLVIKNGTKFMNK